MRPFLPLAFAAAALLASACDKSKALEGQARAAVAQSLNESTAPATEILHTDAATQVVCGSVTSAEKAEAPSRPFIYRNGALKLYHGEAPGWDDVRQLALMDSGGEQAAMHFQMDDGCAFPEAWKQACSPAAAPIAAPDGEVCSLWKAQQYQKLFDHVRQ